LSGCGLVEEGTLLEAVKKFGGNLSQGRIISSTNLNAQFFFIH